MGDFKEGIRKMIFKFNIDYKFSRNGSEHSPQILVFYTFQLW